MMDEYLFTPDLTNFTVVDDLNVNSNMLLLFHGTSTFYSDRIETEGLTVGHLPIGRDVLEEVRSFLEQLPIGLQAETAIKKLMGDLTNYLQFVHSISTTLVGYAAVQYASAPVKGGQIIMVLLNEVREIKLVFHNLPSDFDNRADLIARFDLLAQKVEQFCTQITAADGVIYLIQPIASMIQTMSISGGAVLSSASIAPDRIIGKIIIPNGTTFDQSQRQVIQKVFEKKRDTPGSIGHRITLAFFARPQADEDEENLDN